MRKNNSSVRRIPDGEQLTKEGSRMNRGGKRKQSANDSRSDELLYQRLVRL